ncbi:MAG: hypothetical protein SFV19_12415 [Rhodospirillaceae bacterium]|nr:hypothetical protein [Rhodospirillaceae bacterium]
MKVPRSPWPEDFPPVVLHTNVKTRDAHPAYAAAKSGDAAAAYRLSQDLLSEDAVKKLRQIVSGRAFAWLPVHAEEVQGFNAIPIGFANALADILGGAVIRSVFQANIVAHTRADGFHRIAHQPVFSGSISVSGDFIAVDDHFGMGGTLANLRGHVMHLGRRIVAASTLTASRGNDIIALQAQTLAALKAKHGGEVESLVQEEIGFGADCLTEPEAQYLIRAQKIDSIRERLAAAKS